MSMRSNGRVVLLGIDGATFYLLDPLLAAGRLPRLSALLAQGARGPLLSTIHPLTPAAWTSCVTGLNPGKHGIFDFRRRRHDSYEMEFVNARRRDGAPLWRLLAQAGWRSGIFNVPMTYPPDDLDGFIVSGMDTPSISSNFTYPAELRARLLAGVPDYAIDLDDATDDEAAFLARLDVLADGQRKAIEFLIGEYPDLDFLMAVLVATDRLHHTFWHYLDPAQPAYHSPGAAAAQAAQQRIWQGIEQTLGNLQEWAGPDATFVIISDHGFGILDKDVYMNRFLLDEGLLAFKGAAQKGQRFAEVVDWPQTRAYSFGFFGNISLNLRGREPQGVVEQGREAEELKAHVSERLLDLRDPADGRPLVDRVYRREELYSGPYVPDAPDLLVVMRNYAYMTRDGYEGVTGVLLGPPALRKGRLPHSGNHRPDGVFIMAGPGVQPGVHLSGASIMDVAPTVLYAAGLPAPAAMDGRVLSEAFSRERLLADPPRRIAAQSGRAPGVQDQLGALEQQVRDVQAALTRLESESGNQRAYIARLEATIETKNRHITYLEDLVRGQQASSAMPGGRLARLLQRLSGKR